MSTRTRRADLSYTARLQQRSAAPRRRRPAPPWLTDRRWPALLALAAELGHLAAALVGWPASSSGGALHVAAAAVLGLVAAGVYFGPHRLVLPAAIGTGAALLLGTLAGMSPVGTAVIVLEVALAAFLVGSWWAPAPSSSRRIS